jgi:predicted nucleotidyltransferase
MPTLPNSQQQAFINRFRATCEADERVIAAFLGGSYAAGTADEFSDLDIYVVTTDEGYDSFFAGRLEFMRALGDPVFLEDFNAFGFDMVLFTYADDVEGELGLGRESAFDIIHGGPYSVLLDKRGVLAGKTFPLHLPTEEGQREMLRQTLSSFWESVSRFIAFMGRGQLWSAYFSLHNMRARCIDLLRLDRDFTSETEGYWKVEQVLAPEDFVALERTVVPLEPAAMLGAAHTLVKTYEQVARRLTERHGMPYFEGLQRVLTARLNSLQR